VRESVIVSAFEDPSLPLDGRIRHPALAKMILVSAGKDEKAVAAEHSNREVVVNGKAEFARESEKSLAKGIAQFGGARSVKMV